MDLLEGGDDVVHVLVRTEQEILPEPERLFPAEQIAVRTADRRVVEPVAGAGQKRSERLVAKQRLVRKRIAVSGGARNALRFQRVAHRLAPCAELAGVDP